MPAGLGRCKRSSDNACVDVPLQTQLLRLSQIMCEIRNPVSSAKDGRWATTGILYFPVQWEGSRPGRFPQHGFGWLGPAATSKGLRSLFGYRPGIIAKYASRAAAPVTELIDLVVPSESQRKLLDTEKTDSGFFLKDFCIVGSCEHDSPEALTARPAPS